MKVKTVTGKNRLTFLEACRPSSRNLFPAQSATVNLETEDSSFKIAPVSTTSSNSNWIVRTQSKATNTLNDQQLRVYPQLCNASFVIVRGANVIPRSVTYFPTCDDNRLGEDAVPTNEPGKQRAWSYQPKMYSPTWAGFVVNNGTFDTLVIYPRENGNGGYRI